MTFQKQSFLVLTLLETIFTRLTNQVSCYLKAVLHPEHCVQSSSLLYRCLSTFRRKVLLRIATWRLWGQWKLRMCVFQIRVNTTACDCCQRPTSCYKIWDNRQIDTGIHNLNPSWPFTRRTYLVLREVQNSQILVHRIETPSQLNRYLNIWFCNVSVNIRYSTM